MTRSRVVQNQTCWWQVAQWDFKNNAPAFVLEVPLRNLLTSMCDFVPRDRVAQRTYQGRAWLEYLHCVGKTLFTLMPLMAPVRPLEG